VVDTGIGIPADRLPALFSKFMQVDSSNTRRFGGTGLGLSICYDLARLMGGHIKAESKLGSGSRFSTTLQLPRVGDAAPRGATNPEVSAPSLRSLPLRVLAAEDNAVNQLVLKVLLDQIGIAPTVVDNGRQALEAWQADSWDIILMDVQMPEMDGIAATKAIRRLEASSRRTRTPIIALSANVMSHQISEYRESGMDGHIGKPIDIRTLYSVIERFAAAEEKSDPLPKRAKPGSV
jgi:CheY-like chemotaxis protein